ncbi:hypothetical protein BB558_001445 [Smittium angustum]|uniref:Uncharacterized protein n=1 Tax=Smittium angustum TaxID=133377 RepID=A0A2U1JBR9_SMIAN|nr:hypothetical protein BB558_001445 [Smittium angustum]
MNINDLPFQTQSTIFYYAQNPNLATVSRNFYEVAHDSSTILKCLLHWNTLEKGDCCYFCKYNGMLENKNLVKAVINKNAYLPKVVYNPEKLFYSSIKHDWLDILELLLTKTTLEKISLDTFILLENAHTIQVDVSKQHDITAQDLVGGNASIYIHQRLDRDSYLQLLETFVFQLDFSSAEYVLSSTTYELINGEFIIDCIDSDNIEVFIFGMEQVKKANINIDFNLIEYSRTNYRENIYHYLVTTTTNFEDKEKVDEILKDAFLYQNIETLEYLIGKGAELTSIKDSDILDAMECHRIDSLVYYFENIGLENISEEIIPTLLKNYSFREKINLDKEPQILQFLTTTKADLKNKKKMRKIFKSAFILDSVDTLKYLSENGAEISIIEDNDIESAIESDSINSLMYYVENVGLENINEDMKLSFLKCKKFAEKFNLDKEPHICKFLTTTNENLKDKKQIKKLLKIALYCDSVDTLKYLVGKGAKLSSFTCGDIGKAVDYNSVNCLTYYVEVLGIENIKKSTTLALIKSKNIALKNKLLDLGLDPHINKHYLLHSSLNGYNSYTKSDIFDEILNFIKRLLDAGCDLYVRRSEILVYSIELNQPEIAKLILNYRKKLYPNIRKKVGMMILENEVDLVRVFLSDYQDIRYSLDNFFYYHRKNIGMEMAKVFLEFGVCVGGKCGMRMLKYAIESEKVELANLLIEFDITLNYDALQVFRDAVSIGCTSVVEKYLQNEMFINIYLKDELIYFCYTNRNSSIEMIIKFYISSKRNEKKVNSSNFEVSSLVNTRDGRPLEIAIKNENVEMINTLLKYGAKITPKNKNLFLDSIKHENIDLMNRYLEILDVKNKVHRDIIGEGLSHAILYSHFTTEISENVKNIPQNIKNIILQQACNVGNVEYARKAIEMGADTCTEGNLDQLKEIVSKETDLNIYDGMILKQAGKSCNIKIVNFLLSKGAKPEKIVWNSI